MRVDPWGSMMYTLAQPNLLFPPKLSELSKDIIKGDSLPLNSLLALSSQHLPLPLVDHLPIKQPTPWPPCHSTSAPCLCFTPETRWQLLPSWLSAFLLYSAVSGKPRADIWRRFPQTNQAFTSFHVSTLSDNMLKYCYNMILPVTRSSLHNLFLCTNLSDMIVLSIFVPFQTNV